MINALEDYSITAL